jgi:hypothetical protein
MSNKERENRYREALRYFDNAREILRTKAKKKDRYYEDGKYVRMACGTAYIGVLKALDVYLSLKGKPIHRKKYARISVDDYQKRLGTIDKGVLNKFNTTYQVLHLNGYYEGMLKADVIQSGLQSFEEILDEIKPVGDQE